MRLLLAFRSTVLCFCSSAGCVSFCPVTRTSACGVAHVSVVTRGVPQYIRLWRGVFWFSYAATRGVPTYGPMFLFVSLLRQSLSRHPHVSPWRGVLYLTLLQPVTCSSWCMRSAQNRYCSYVSRTNLGFKWTARKSIKNQIESAPNSMGFGVMQQIVVREGYVRGCT